MKVGIITETTPSSGGTHQYLSVLLEALLKYSDCIELVQIRSADYPKTLDKDIIIKSDTSLLLRLKRLLSVFFSLSLKDVGLNVDPEIRKLDLIISPTITLLPYYLGLPYIVTIHDFQHKYYPNFFSISERLTRAILYRTGKFARLVVVESKYVRRDVIKFLKIPESKIAIIASPPPANLSEFSYNPLIATEVDKKYSLPQGYLFYPAHFWHHKNHLRLLDAILILKKEYGRNVPLVLVGAKKEAFPKVVRKAERLGISNLIHYLGYVPGEHMPYLYKKSVALVMPSLFESVSLPIWEAFSLGVPVASSNVCALPEQVGNAGLLFSPNHPEDIAKKIYRLLIDDDLRKVMVKNGKARISMMTHEHYARQWEKLIRQVSNMVH